MDRTVVGQMTGVVLRGLARGDAPTPMMTLLLVRRYADVESVEDVAVAEALGLALAQALQICGAECDGVEQARWLRTLLEASRVCEDDRVPLVCAQLAEGLPQKWTACTAVADAAVVLDAALAYGIVAPALDELERVVGLAYTPGGGTAHSHREPGGARGTLLDHVAAAGALLTACSVTGRIPYGMLAEELIQFVLRTQNPEPFSVRCSLTRVLIRLAGLHRDKDYTDGAIIAGTDYCREAHDLLAGLTSEHTSDGPHAADYGVAVLEWLSLAQKK